MDLKALNTRGYEFPFFVISVQTLLKVFLFSTPIMLIAYILWLKILSRASEWGQLHLWDITT
jgi:hypothetical protein